MPSRRWDPDYLRRPLASIAASKRVIDIYVVARRFYFQRISMRSLARKIVKVLTSKGAHLEAFELALLLGAPAVVQAEDRPVFQNVRALRGEALGGARAASQSGYSVAQP